jgi:F-type H+-transporting ATPase subunit delta
MLEGSIARRYAQALFNLSHEGGRAQADYDALKTLTEALAEQPGTLAALCDVTVERERRKKAVEAVASSLGAGTVLRNFLLLLVDRERMAHLPGVFRAFEELRNAAEGKIKAEVRTAQPLGAEEKARLSAALSKRLSKSVELSESVDPELLGGAWVRVGSLALDGTLKSQLERLAAHLAGA